MRLNDFQGKEVINACDGKKLGYIVDFAFDEKMWTDRSNHYSKDIKVL